jgi:hypothetical protein
MMHCFVDTYLVCVRTMVRVQLTRDSVGLLVAWLTLLHYEEGWVRQTAIHGLMDPFFVMYRTVVFELEILQRCTRSLCLLESSTLKVVLSLSVPFERSNSAFF